MSILKEIYNYKIDFVTKQKETISQSSIEAKINLSDSDHSSFYKKLKAQENKISIIGEVKKASPSLGYFVNKEINLVDVAQTYEKCNISCISVLTDEKYFKGSLDDLVNIRSNISIPILRKDFIVDDYQIYESKLNGANCILIILSMLNMKEAQRFAMIAQDLGIDSIIEVHNVEELLIAKSIKSSKIIGINNRNLNNFKTDLNISIKLSKYLEENEKLVISESGFHGKKDIQKIIEATGINNFLIGEFLMKSDNLSHHISDLLT